MPGTMATEDLVLDLQRSLHDNTDVFDAANGGDFERFLRQALGPMAAKRPVTQLGTITLVAGEPRYPLAAYPDCIAYKTHLWGATVGGCCPRPWEPGYPGALPRVSAVRDAAGAMALAFEPAPTVAHIGALGSAFRFWYFAAHRLQEGATPCSVAPSDRGLLLLRAQVEMLLELAIRNAGKPVQLRDGFSGSPRNSTPAALAQALLQIFEAAP